MQGFNTINSIFLMKKSFKQNTFFLLITFFMISCGNRNRAVAEVSASTTQLLVGEETILSAKHSQFDSISWYLEEELETRCSQKVTCEFIFEDPGEFTVKVVVTTDPPTFPIILPMPTSDSVTIKLTVNEE